MKLLILTASALLLLSPPLIAQNPSSATPAGSSPERLDELLKAWEKRMAGVDNLVADVTCIETHALTKKKTIYAGQVAFMRPNLLRIDLTREDEVGKKDVEKTSLQRIYFDKARFYIFDPAGKRIEIRDRVVKKKVASDFRTFFGSLENSLVVTALRGTKADDVKKRFELVLQEPKDPKSSQWYAYVMFIPKSDKDKQDFTAAQITFWLKNPNPEGESDLTATPVRLWYKSPNGKETAYILENLKLNAKLKADDFTPGDVEGYRRVDIDDELRKTENGK